MCTLCVVGIASFGLLIWLILSRGPSGQGGIVFTSARVDLATPKNGIFLLPLLIPLEIGSRLGPCEVGFGSHCVGKLHQFFFSTTSYNDFDRRNERLSCDAPLLEWVTVVQLGTLAYLCATGVVSMADLPMNAVSFFVLWWGQWWWHFL